jgi:butyrate kinase
MFKILVINPGSTSTEIALFQEENEIRSVRTVHPVEELRRFDRIIDQFPCRRDIVKSQLAEWGIFKGDLAAVIGRSALHNKESGVYEVNAAMIDDVKAGRSRIEHAAILGCLLARDIADFFRAPAFVDHIAFSSFIRLATVSGLPDIERRPAYHVQNIEAVASVAARDMNRNPDDVNFIIAHLEGGMSIAALEGGKLIDSTNALDEGPFTTERSGSLPCVALVDLCFSGRYTKAQVLKLIRGKGGMVAFLGTNKLSEIETRVKEGDEQATFYLEAMSYQIAKDIGAMASVLKGKVDAVILTGKILASASAVNWIKERIGFLAPVKTYPEEEGLSFARAALKILRGEEKLKIYA